MIKIKPRKIWSKIIKYPWKESALSLKYLPKVFSKYEKIIIVALFVLIIISALMIGDRYWLQTTKVIPQAGGTYREGIVGETKDLDKHSARLLNAGLTKYDNQKNIVGDLAEKWDINENGKQYVFHLRPQVSADDLAGQIISKGYWNDIEIATPDPATITFTFKQPFSPFLYSSTEPIFNYGPYKITKESKNEVEFSARDDYYAGRPYIDKVIIKFYRDQKDLIKAAKRGDIDGLSTTTDIDQIKNFQKMEIALPRELLIFFNLSKDQLKDVNVRKALKENGALSKPLEIRFVSSDTPNNAQMAREIADRWTKNGVKVNLEIKDNVTMQKTIIPKRDYDVLLYGLDYGEDPDPYPFWHSSQIKEDGRNLSNFKNLKGDKLLEDARQEFDFKKREDKYAEFQKILDQEIPVFTVEKENLYWQVGKKILGIDKIVGALETDRFLNVGSWYIETKRVKK